MFGLDEALNLQRNHGFAQRRTAYGKLLGQIALVRQSLPRFIDAGPDLMRQRAGDLLVSLAGFRGGGGHNTILACPVSPSQGGTRWMLYNPAKPHHFGMFCSR